MFDDIITEKPKELRFQKLIKINKEMKHDIISNNKKDLKSVKNSNTKLETFDEEIILPDGWKRIRTSKGKTVIKRST